MATLKEKRDAAVKQAQALIEKTRNGDELTEQESAQLKELVADAKSLGEKITEAKDAEDLLASMGTPVTDVERKAVRETVAKSLGEHAVKGLGDNLALIKGRRKVQADVSDWTGRKAAGDPNTTANSVGASHLESMTVDENVVRQVVQRPTIADWLGAGTLSTAAITYFVEKVWDTGTNGNFATVAENTRKPGMTAPDYQEVTETLKKIAGWIKVSMEMAEDYGFIVSEINNRLLFQLTVFEEEQLLNGDGTGTNVKGLLLRDGLQTDTIASKTGNFDGVFKALQKVYLKTGLRADGIVMNPSDYAELRLTKDANNQYLAGGPFTGQYGVGGVMVDPPLWGVPVIQTTAMAQGTALVGAGKQAATVYRKGGIRVEASNVDGEDFTNNRFTILAEERLTLAVRRPDAFLKLTLGAK